MATNPEFPQYLPPEAFIDTFKNKDFDLQSIQTVLSEARSTTFGEGYLRMR